jgi:hypothetical protein
VSAISYGSGSGAVAGAAAAAVAGVGAPAVDEDETGSVAASGDEPVEEVEVVEAAGAAVVVAFAGAGFGAGFGSGSGFGLRGGAGGEAEDLGDPDGRPADLDADPDLGPVPVEDVALVTGRAHERAVDARHRGAAPDVLADLLPAADRGPEVGVVVEVVLVRHPDAVLARHGGQVTRHGEGGEAGSGTLPVDGCDEIGLEAAVGACGLGGGDQGHEQGGDQDRRPGERPVPESRHRRHVRPFPLGRSPVTCGESSFGNPASLPIARRGPVASRTAFSGGVPFRELRRSTSLPSHRPGGGGA